MFWRLEREKPFPNLAVIIVISSGYFFVLHQLNYLIEFVLRSQTGTKNQRKGRFQTNPYWTEWQNHLLRSLAAVGNNRNSN